LARVVVDGDISSFTGTQQASPARWSNSTTGSLHQHHLLRPEGGAADVLLDGKPYCHLAVAQWLAQSLTTLFGAGNNTAEHMVQVDISSSSNSSFVSMFNIKLQHENIKAHDAI